jgi:hypothetical protein
MMNDDAAGERGGFVGETFEGAWAFACRVGLVSRSARDVHGGALGKQGKRDAAADAAACAGDECDGVFHGFLPP